MLTPWMRETLDQPNHKCAFNNNKNMINNTDKTIVDRPTWKGLEHFRSEGLETWSSVYWGCPHRRPWSLSNEVEPKKTDRDDPSGTSSTDISLQETSIHFAPPNGEGKNMWQATIGCTTSCEHPPLRWQIRDSATMQQKTQYELQTSKNRTFYCYIKDFFLHSRRGP